MALARRRAIALLLLTIGGAAFAGDHFTRDQRENDAKAAGFADLADRERASRAGIGDSAAWSAKLKNDAEKIAAEEADKKREWEARAPEREARAKAQKLADAAAAEARRPASDRLKISGQSWRTGGFDTIGMMTFTVSNENPYSVKDISISCDFYGNSGTLLGSRSHTVYEIVKANTKRTFKAVNIGFIPPQSARGGCSIDRAGRS